MYNFSILPQKLARNTIFSKYYHSFTSRWAGRAPINAIVFFSAILTCLCIVSPPLHAQMCNDTFFVKFPDDRIVTICDGTGNYGIPVFFEPVGSVLATSFKDDTIRVVSDACFRIERTWKIINWCSYNPVCRLVKVSNPMPNPVVNNQANLSGPTVSNICDITMANPWNSTVIKVVPTDPAPTNYCTFFMKEGTCTGGPAKFNGYEYTQIIKVIDTQKPVATCVKPDTCDLTDNDAAF